jgi:hypothetical protein
MKLESGPATTDRNWHMVRAILFLGFAGYFVYDGAVGWPNKNRTEAERLLTAPQPFNGQITWASLGEKPTLDEYEQLQQHKPARREEVHTALGPPTFTNGPEEYFITRYGYGKVTYARDRVGEIGTWINWFKTADEVRQQFYWAIVPAIPGLWFFWRMFKAITLRVTIDDEGMVYDKERIPFTAMVDLRDYSPKGWIDLYYKDGEAEKKLRLDNQKVKLFDEIVAALCQAKGFRNEVKIHAEEQARRKADEERAAAAEEAVSDEDDTK